MIGLSDGALARIAIAATGVAPRRRRRWLGDIVRRLEALTPGPATGGHTAADRTKSVSERDRRIYARAYAQSGAMRAGFEVFRAFERMQRRSRASPRLS
jgi:hypothetical protein